MQFSFDADQLAFRDALRAVLAKHCTPDDVRATWESASGWSRDRWRALAELGVTGTLVPEDRGGLGLDDTTLVLLIEEAGRAALPEPLGDTAAVAVTLLRDAAAGELGDEWLPRIAAGDAIVAVGLPGRHSIPHAESADLLLIADGTALHALAPEDTTVTAQPSLNPGGRAATVDWSPSDWTLIAADCAQALSAATTRAAVVGAAFQLGTARQLVDMATGYAKEREQFGAPIGSFQAIKHHLADALLRTEFAAPVVYRAAWSVATGAPAAAAHGTAAARAAAAAATLAGRVALQVHGAMGYTWEHDLHLWLRPALAGQA